MEPVGRAVAIVVACLLCAAPAAASEWQPAHGISTLVLDDGTYRPQPLQRWANLAAVPTPPGEVQVSLDHCPMDPPGPCTTDKRVFLAAAIRPRRALRVTLYHELGHVFDAAVLTDGDRDRFRSIMRDPREWASDDRNPPDEQFAVAYSLCANPRVAEQARFEGHYYWGVDYLYSPTVAQHRQVCDLIAGR